MDTLDTTVTIPDGDPQGVVSIGNETFNGEVERVTVSLTFSTPYLGDLELYLISPDGTVSQLINDDVIGRQAFNGTWTFESQAFRGEDAFGQWKVRIVDDAAGDVLQVSDIKIKIFARPGHEDDVYVYTDEYAEMIALRQGHGWEWRDSDGGVDTANFAALSSDTMINYSTGETLIDGLRQFGGFGSSDPRFFAIENFTFGDGNDTIVANEFNNVILGMRGNDTLNGAAGDDTLNGGDGRDILIGGPGNDTFYLTDRFGGAYDEVRENADEGKDFVFITPLHVSGNDFYQLTPNVEGGELLGTMVFDLIGNASDNLLMGNSGNNRLDGGFGNDTVSYAHASGAVTVSLQVIPESSGQANGSAGIDTLLDRERDRQRLQRHNQRQLRR